ncbi:hypothetical protein DMC30DRAFT_414290 [Rhodotorula diobovata]|uniref:Dienelactone hydrolase domain-containing protein n=1 Tax=Rhodotorula diobovata TaxID=5288 RepID=A0A5C5G297_9BASI|nr:hypothetical protein DMC30DRAFT_414290 [Rhodotorula diobovata]
MATAETSDAAKQAYLEAHRLEGEPKGTMAKLNGISYYLAKGNGDHTDKAIVLGTDLFGLGVPGPKLMADWFAQKLGFDVLVPDVFEGDYIDRDRLKPQLEVLDEQVKGKSFVGRLKHQASTLWALSYGIGPTYLVRHSASHTLSLAEKFCIDVRKEAGYTRLGFVGYAFGGSHAVHLAGSAKSPKPVDVVVAFHPAPIHAKDFKKVAVPFMLSLAEEDSFLSAPPVLAALASLPPSVPTQTYDDARGTVHGYGSRPDLARTEVREAFAIGLERTAEWFRAHL